MRIDKHKMISKQKKILVIINGFASAVSGGDVHLINLIKAISKKHSLTVILPKRAVELFGIGGCGAKLIEISERGEIDKKEDMIRTYFHRARETSKFLKKNKFDLIITANPFFSDVLPLRVLKNKGKRREKVLSYVFHVLPKRKTKGIKEKLFYSLVKIQQGVCLRIMKKKSDLILTCNRIETGKITKMMKKMRGGIAHIGTNINEIDEANGKKKKNTALFVGRLVKQKGIFDLVEIMKKIVRQKGRENFTLYIIGDGPEREKLSDEIRKANLEKNILVLGFLKSKKELFRKMKECEFFFFPSYEEGFGIVIAEALYCQCKVICYWLEHYKDFFKDFPEYIKMGAINPFANKLNMKRDLKKQKKFARRYDYSEQIKNDVRMIESLMEK